MVPLTSGGEMGRVSSLRLFPEARSSWDSGPAEAPGLCCSHHSTDTGRSGGPPKPNGGSEGRTGRGNTKERQQLRRLERKDGGPFPLLVPFFSPAGVGRS